LENKQETLWFIKDGPLQAGVNLTCEPLALRATESLICFSAFEEAKIKTYSRNENPQELQTKP